MEMVKETFLLKVISEILLRKPELTYEILAHILIKTTMII
jgi:hypothetical protein